MSKNDMKNLKKFIACAVIEERITEKVAIELYFFVEVLCKVDIDWRAYIEFFGEVKEEYEG